MSDPIAIRISKTLTYVDQDGDGTIDQCLKKGSIGPAHSIKLNAPEALAALKTLGIADYREVQTSKALAEYARHILDARALADAGETAGTYLELAEAQNYNEAAGADWGSFNRIFNEISDKAEERGFKRDTKTFHDEIVRLEKEMSSLSNQDLYIRALNLIQTMRELDQRCPLSSWSNLQIDRMRFSRDCEKATEILASRSSATKSDLPFNYDQATLLSMALVISILDGAKIRQLKEREQMILHWR